MILNLLSSLKGPVFPSTHWAQGQKKKLPATAVSSNVENPKVPDAGNDFAALENNVENNSEVPDAGNDLAASEDNVENNPEVSNAENAPIDWDDENLEGQVVYDYANSRLALLPRRANNVTLPPENHSVQANI